MLEMDSQNKKIYNPLNLYTLVLFIMFSVLSLCSFYNFLKFKQYKNSIFYDFPAASLCVGGRGSELIVYLTPKCTLLIVN